MATVLTGQDLSLTIGGDVFDAQTISTTFTYVNNREVLETLDGPVYKTLTFEYTLDVNMYSDWGTTNALCEALVVGRPVRRPTRRWRSRSSRPARTPRRPCPDPCSPRSRRCPARVRTRRPSASR